MLAKRLLLLIVFLTLVRVAHGQIFSLQTTSEIGGMPNASSVHGPDPVCPGSPELSKGPQWLGLCVTLEVVLPVGAQYIDATPEARDHYGVGDWKQCPAYPDGAVYAFMNCAPYVNGYLRFMYTSPSISSQSDGIHVRWQLINWATYPREGRLTVRYEMDF